MTPPNTLTSETRSTISVDGLEVEIFATEEEAASAFAAVPPYVEQQAAAFVAATKQIASELEV
jgi:hypothetical protein